MTYLCENCRYYKFDRIDEYAGKVGQCRYNPPTYNWNNHTALNNFPRIKADAWCGKFEQKC